MREAENRTLDGKETGRRRGWLQISALLVAISAAVAVTLYPSLAHFRAAVSVGVIGEIVFLIAVFPLGVGSLK